MLTESRASLCASAVAFSFSPLARLQRPHSVYPILLPEVLQKLIDLAEDETVERIEAHADAMVCDSILRKVVGSNTIASIPASNERFSKLVLLVSPVLLLLFA